MKTPTKKTLKKSIGHVASRVVDDFLDWSDDDRFDNALSDYERHTKQLMDAYVDLCDTAEEVKQVWKWYGEIIAEIGLADTLNKLAKIWCMDDAEEEAEDNE